ncbi:Uncharacterized protein SCF082_LOCUS31987, partial [Durusdinium trenchii]
VQNPLQDPDAAITAHMEGSPLIRPRMKIHAVWLHGISLHLKVKSILDRINIRNFIGKDAVIKVEYLTSCRYWKKWFDDNLHVTFRGGLKSDDTGHHAFIFMRLMLDELDVEYLSFGQTNNLPKLENMEKEDRESLKDHFKERFEHSASEKARSNKNMNAVKKGNLKCMTKRPKYPKCTMLGGSSDYPCGFKSVKDAFNWIYLIAWDPEAVSWRADVQVEDVVEALTSFEKQRFLTGDEMIASQVLPVTVQQASLSGAPKLELGELPNSTKAKMAGNSMSALCCGAMLLTCILALELKAEMTKRPLDTGGGGPSKAIKEAHPWAEEIVSFCEASSSGVVDLPVLCFLYRYPVDGMPTLHSWISVLRAILLNGFETWREVMEVKAVDDPIPLNQPLDYGKVLPDPALNFKSAFLKAVDEFNGYGSAVFSSKSRIDSNTALQLYGFTVPRPELTSLFKEHAPVEEDHVRERLTIATQQLSDLNREAKDAMYAADTVALAHDLAQIGQVYKAITQNEHSKKTEKILHLKAQNAIGSAIVADHMNANMAVHSGVIKDQLNVAERVEYDMNPGKKGWDKLKILLPPNIRQRHVDDPIHGGEWYGKQVGDKDAALVAKQEAEDKEAQAIKSTPWIEPESMQLLNDQYIIESKFAGRCPGTTMYLVAHCEATISHSQFQIAHGPSKFIKSEKVANMQRQESGTPGTVVN